MAFLDTAAAELDFLIQEADDQLRILETVDTDISLLIDLIGTTIKRYLPETKKKLVLAAKIDSDLSAEALKNLVTDFRNRSDLRSQGTPR